MEEQLKYTFGVVNEWLKFAEAKNGALLIALGAIAPALADHFPEYTNSPPTWLCYYLGSTLFFLSGLVCLVSFLPQLTFSWGAAKKQVEATDNLYFFGHLAQFSPFGYLEALYQAESVKPQNKKLEIDLAGQVIRNAEITNKKFLHFKLATFLALGGMFSFAFAMIFDLITRV